MLAPVTTHWADVPPASGPCAAGGRAKRPRVQLHAGVGSRARPAACGYSTRMEFSCTSQMTVSPSPAVKGVENSSCPPVVRAIRR